MGDVAVCGFQRLRTATLLREGACHGNFACLTFIVDIAWNARGLGGVDGSCFLLFVGSFRKCVNASAALSALSNIGVGQKRLYHLDPTAEWSATHVHQSECEPFAQYHVRVPRAASLSTTFAEYTSSLSKRK